MEALDLEGKDKFLGGLIKGKSDPYGVLQIGNQLFQSKTVKESLHPKWNEVYEVSASCRCPLEAVRVAIITVVGQRDLRGRPCWCTEK